MIPSGGVDEAVITFNYYITLGPVVGFLYKPHVYSE